MALIPDSFIQELLNRVDIVEVIDSYVALKKAGLNYQACCPFHQEKSPSFSVSPTKQFYHCFGCGAHGTAISFMMEHVGLGFVDAVHTLAKRVGLSVPQEPSSPQELQRKAQQKQEDASTQDALALATRYYQQQLKHTPDAISYLKNRGLTGDIALRFGLGYAPSGWQNLAQVFVDYTENKLLTLHGLVIQKEEKRYDRFRERIMFPIINIKGQIIGFGGRILEQGEPKYLNSPETPLFQKGQELYGLYQARSAIRTHGRVLVVEGYMDVVALAQLGVDYAVATLGTATTAEHVQQLFRHTDCIWFCFDGDRAGKQAAWRALTHTLPLLKESKQANFIFLPDGQDPDSYIRSYGKERFILFCQEKSLSLIEFLLQQLCAETTLETPEGRAKLIHLVKPYLAQLQSAILRVVLVQRLSQLAQLSETLLQQLLSESLPASPMLSEPPATLSPKQIHASPTHFTPKQPKLNTKYGALEKIHPSLLRSLLLHCLRSPHVLLDLQHAQADVLLKQLPPTASNTILLNWIANATHLAKPEHQQYLSQQLFAHMPEAQQKIWLKEYQDNALQDASHFVLSDWLSKIKRQVLEIKIEQLSQQSLLTTELKEQILLLLKEKQQLQTP